MQMYIEDAIFNTLIINCVILFLTQFSLKIKFKFWKTFLASFFGCMYAIMLEKFNFYNEALIILKICCGLIICTFMVPKFTFKNVLCYFLVFVSFTFLLGGFSYAILFLIVGENYSLQNLMSNPPYLFSIIYILMAVYICFLVKVIKFFYKKQKVENYIYNLKIICNNKKFYLDGYLDSGNFLVEKNTKLPIIIVNSKTFFKIFKNINILDALKCKLDKKISGKYIDYSTISGSDKIFIFKPEKAYIKENNNYKSIDIYLGFSFKFDVKNKNFDVLLSPLCFNNN